MPVQGKFFVQVLERNEGAATAARVKLGAVCRGRVNKEWSAATPWGHIEMGILNEAATEQFEEGAEYLVTFTKVTKPERGDGHQPDSQDPWPAECGVCGMYAVKQDDGSLDWSAHYEFYGEPG